MLYLFLPSKSKKYFVTLHNKYVLAQTKTAQRKQQLIINILRSSLVAAKGFGHPSAYSEVLNLLANGENQNTECTIFPSSELFVDWRDLEFSHPERKIRLATSFSGIGAIEHTFQRLGLNFEIVFAGDIDNKMVSLFKGFLLIMNDKHIWSSTAILFFKG